MAHAGRTAVPPVRVRRRLRHRAMMWRLLSRRHEDWLPFPLALWFWLGPAALAWVVAGTGLPVLLAVAVYRPGDLPGEWPGLALPGSALPGSALPGSALPGSTVWPAVLEGVAWALVLAGAWSYAGYALFTCAPARRVRIWRDALVREYASWRREHDRDVRGERIRAGRCGRIPRRVLGWTGAVRTGAPSWRRLHAMRWARADEVMTIARRLGVISAGVVSGATLAWRYGLLPGSALGTSGPAALGTSGAAALGTSGAAALGTSASAALGTSGAAALGTSASAALGTSASAALGTSGAAALGTSASAALDTSASGAAASGAWASGAVPIGTSASGAVPIGASASGAGASDDGWLEVTRAVAGDWLGILGGIVPGVDLPDRLGLGRLGPGRPGAPADSLGYDVTMIVLGLAVLVPLACYVVQVLRDPRDLDPEWPFEDGPAVIAVAQRIGWEDGDLPRSAGGWTGAFTDAARRLDREEITPPPGSRRWTAEDVWNEVTDALDDPPPEWLPPPCPG